MCATVCRHLRRDAIYMYILDSTIWQSQDMGAGREKIYSVRKYYNYMPPGIGLTSGATAAN